MRILLFHILFLFTVSGFSQEVKNAFGHYDIKNFSVQEGLCESTIEWIEQDSKGFLWIGTHGGLSRFDGKKFKNYSVIDGLPSNGILCIKEAPDGTMWVATHKGLANINNDKIKVFTSKDGLYHEQVWRLVYDKNNVLYIGTSKGINVLKDGKILPFYSSESTVPDDNVIRALFFDSKNQLWFNTNKNLYCFKNDKPVLIANSGMCFDILEDKNGAIWFGGWGFSLGKFENNQVIKYYSDSPVTGIEIDVHGNIWGATWDRGLIKFDGKKITSFQTQNGLKINSTWGLEIDNEGTIWVGTFGGGLDKFSGETFVKFNTADGLVNDVITDATIDLNGNIWLATENGVSKFNYSNETIKNFTAEDGLFNGKATGICVGKKNNIHIVYYSGPKAVSEIINDKVVASKYGGGFSIYEDDEGVLWMGTDGGGLLEVREGKNFHHSYSNNRSENRTLGVWKEDNGFWLVPYSGGLQYYNYEKIIYFQQENGFTNESVSGLIKDKKGNYWISAGPYIYICTFENEKFTKRDSISINQYFKKPTINALSFDETKNEIWVGTVNDISKFKIDDYYNKKDISPFFYNKNNGYRGGECFGFLFSEKNEKWILTTDGLWLFQEQYDFKTNSVPVVSINDIKLFWKETNWSDLNITTDNKGLPINLKLEYFNNNLSFYFNAVVLSSPDEVGYSHKLEGLDNDWSPITKSSEITYQNLRPGKYVFWIKAIDANGNWSEPIKFEFVIFPAFWQTTWFIVLVIILFIFLIVFISWYRTRKLNKYNKILELKVKERTAKLKSAYDEIEEKNKDITDSLNYAKKIQESILPNETFFSENFREHFIVFQPRDIVSGDFYFAEQSNNDLFVAVADCTGHGVPGAMVSMVCSNALKKAVKELKISDPGLILDQVGEMIESSFSVHGNKMRDGMDVALVKINKSKSTIEFAGANNPIWVFTQSRDLTEYSNEINKIKDDFWELNPNKQPIGIFAGRKKFNVVEIPYQTGDQILFFSDGFADQFGGKTGKKYKYSKMREFIYGIRNQDLNQQKIRLVQEFNNWKGSLEQLDDICLIGISLK